MAGCDAISKDWRCTVRVICHLFALLAALCASVSVARAEQVSLPGDIGIGLVGIADWSTQQPFIDVMKTARPWIGHRPGQWGGVNPDQLRALGILDENGWPREIPHSLRGIGTVVLTDLPPEATSLAGRYRLSFKGDGIVEVSGRAGNVRYGKGQVEFDFTPGEGPVVITINRTDRRNTGNYIRDISVVKIDKLDLFASGAMFNPDWLARVGDFGLFRFMDWMDTNNSAQSDWSDRPRVEDVTYATHGVPIEVMIRLANESGTDPWFNIPHLATDEYVRAFATIVRDTLDPSLTAYAEFSNEVWNWQFQQAVWAEELGQQRWGKEYAWMQTYGMRTAQVMQIWRGVFAGAPDRLVTVISTQTGWQGLEHDALEAALWRAEDASHPRPADVVDAYAVAGYFGHILGSGERAALVHGWLDESALLAEDGIAGRYDHAIALATRELRNGSVSGDATDTLADLESNTFPYHAGVAGENGLSLIMYEGGSHVTGSGAILDDAELAEFFVALNYAPEMGALYTELLGIWHRAGGRLFNAYADVANPGKWGSWGTLRHLGDDNARWRALIGVPESQP